MSLLGCAFATGVVAANTAADGSVRTGTAVSVLLPKPLPSLVRIGDLLTITGRVRNAPPGTRAVLQSKRTSNWSVLTKARVRSRLFTLRWRVPKSTMTGSISLRVAAVNAAGATLAATPAKQAGVGPAPVYCAPPVPPAINIPVGDGWIVGGRYGEGGAYPGIYACDSEPYTVSASNQSGIVVASQQVPALHSYTLVVPAGNYTLRSDACTGSATVTAGKQSVANTYCLYP
jgi:hypothetical protein